MAWLGVRVLHFAAFCQKGQVSREDSRCVFFQPSLLEGNRHSYRPTLYVPTAGSVASRSSDLALLRVLPFSFCHPSGHADGLSRQVGDRLRRAVSHPRL